MRRPPKRRPPRRRLRRSPSPRRLPRSRLRTPPPVPCTALYTRHDGVVPWQTCREDAHPFTENIEIPATHIGIGVNPLALYAIADRLAQPEGQWRPFEKTGLKALLYRERG